MKRCLVVLLSLFLALRAGGGVLVWSGAYNVADDDPHWRPVF